MKKKQFLSLLLVAAMAASLVVGCGEDGGDDFDDTEVVTAGTEAAESTDGESSFDAAAYGETSKEIYNAALGEYYETYMTAKEAENVSERYALMAIAEAKLQEAAIMLPLFSDGGRFAVSNVAPYSGDYTQWGNDDYRFHNYLVCNEHILSSDITALRELWAEVKGTGTYLEKAREYLTSNGYTIKDTYNYPYSSDPVTWDVLATSLAADSEAIINTYDGLMEYDSEGTLQPALAESYEVSEDGLTYTFHIRQGQVWVDSQGRTVDTIKADDFVAGFQHMMDAQGGLEWLVEGIVKNASQYISGEITDMAEVGVQATDEYTLVYTLEEPCSYFTTMLSYGVFAPMSRSYYESQGGKFGSEYTTDMDYGTDSDHIAYCGPYLVTAHTDSNTIVFSANENWWNIDNLNVKTITWLYNDGSDVTKAYNDFLAGTLDGVSLNSSTLEIAQKDGNFDKYAYVSNNGSTSYMGFFNLNRAAFANVNDGSVASTQDAATAERTNAAMNNVHFRRALAMSVDRASYNAQQKGEDLKLNALRNSYVPGNFVALEEDVTVDINGTATTFAAGTYYGEIMQAQIDADGVKIKVWDPEGNAGDGSSDGFDGWYNVENANEELAIAVEELAAAGVEVSAENPIHVDLPYASNSEPYTNSANTFKQSVEEATNGAIIVDLVACADYNEWYYAGYYTDYGYEANYDIYDLSGWGPDYGDPSTYLDTMLPDYAGYMARCLGVY